MTPCLEICCDELSESLHAWHSLIQGEKMKNLPRLRSACGTFISPMGSCQSLLMPKVVRHWPTM